jgi:hypothetical protein
MSIYDIKGEAYLGAGEDAAHHCFQAFRIGQEIHVVYNLGEPNEHVAKADVYEVSSNPNKYLWTPFAQFSLVGSVQANK